MLVMTTSPQLKRNGSNKHPNLGAEFVGASWETFRAGLQLKKGLLFDDFMHRKRCHHCEWLPIHINRLNTADLQHQKWKSACFHRFPCAVVLLCWNLPSSTRRELPDWCVRHGSIHPRVCCAQLPRFIRRMYGATNDPGRYASYGPYSWCGIDNTQRRRLTQTKHWWTLLTRLNLAKKNNFSFQNVTDKYRPPFVESNLKSDRKKLVSWSRARWLVHRSGTAMQKPNILPPAKAYIATTGATRNAA